MMKAKEQAEKEDQEAAAAAIQPEVRLSLMFTFMHYSLGSVMPPYNSACCQAPIW